jgi:hypothetical protein
MSIAKVEPYLYLYGRFVCSCLECNRYIIVSTLNINTDIHQSKGSYCDDCIKPVLLQYYNDLVPLINHSEIYVKYKLLQGYLVHRMKDHLITLNESSWDI